MTDPVRRPAALMPAPRHLHKRRFRAEIPIGQMGGYQTSTLADPPKSPAQPLAQSKPVAKSPSPDRNMAEGMTETADAALRRKRLVALSVVILVSVIVPVLALLLIFGQ